jgi:protein-S-isoprenylcysteine O-methyltransferase Ste14
VYGLFSLGRSFSPLASPRKKHRLVTTGLYAHIRHPIYGGMVLAALGLAAITRSEGRLALAILLWFIVEQKAKFEEAALAQRYGEEYAAYKKATSWKLLPCY